SGGPMAFSDFSVLASRARPSVRQSIAAAGRFSGGHHYNPLQPRVPAGQPGAGEWTRVAAEAVRFHDVRDVLGPAAAYYNWASIFRYAARGRRGGGPPEAEPGIALRVLFAERRANQAIARVREWDPWWQPNESVYTTAEGHLATLNAREA